MVECDCKKKCDFSKMVKTLPDGTRDVNLVAVLTSPCKLKELAEITALHHMIQRDNANQQKK